MKEFKKNKFLFLLLLFLFKIFLNLLDNSLILFKISLIPLVKFLSLISFL